MKNGTVLIIIDTETNDVKNPRLIQLGYMLVQADDTVSSGYRVLREVGTLVDQGPELVMNPYAFKVHGISTGVACKFGIAPIAAAQTLTSDILRADVMVFHNASFDLRVLKILATTHYNALTRVLDKTPVLCTMQATKAFCGLLNKAGHPKNPKLSELYFELFDKIYANQHDALGDVRATLRCYFGLPEELQWQN